MQQYRSLARCVILAVASVVVAVAALAALASKAVAVGVLMLSAAAVLAGASRNARHLAQRNRVGADSEDAVRHALRFLPREGWTVQHGVDWPGRGDIDHLVRSPAGMGFAIETKTRSFNQRHLERTVNTARWAAAQRRRYPQGVIPVLCVVRNRGLQHAYGSVLVVSLDRLVRALRNAAGQAAAAPAREQVRAR